MMRLARLVTIAACLCFGSGCGLVVKLTSTPKFVAPGGTVHHNIKLTNPSKCPALAIDAELTPFVPAEDIVVQGDDMIVAFIQALIFGTCTGGELVLPDGVVCRLEELTIICEMESLRTGPDTSGSATVSSSAGVFFTCERDGSQIRCERGPASTTAGSTFATQALTCVPGMGGSYDCTLASLPGGDMATATIDLPAPTTAGLFFNILFGQAVVGRVCADGTNAGKACASVLDCPGGSINNCLSGVCVDDTTGAAGVGCNPDTPACPMGQTCTSCDEGIEELTFPFSCSQTQVVQPTVSPAVSTWGWVAMLFAILALEVARRLRRI